MGDKNWNRSVDFARSAAELGDVTGLYELGIYSQEAEEYEAMVVYFKEALDIDPEYLPAQLELARAYIHGWGVEEDEKRGAEMMLELTNAPDKEVQTLASVNMAVFYARGIGVEPSKARAEEYLEKAENLGYDVPEGIQSIVDELE